MLPSNGSLPPVDAVIRVFAWLNQFRRLRVRYEKRADIHGTFLSLGCALMCWQSLRKIWRTAEADAILPGRPSTRSMLFRGNQVMRPAWRRFGVAGPEHR